MQRRKAYCPHCNKQTEQNHFETLPKGNVRGLEFLKALEKAALKSSVWICLNCFSANANVFEPGAKTVDLEFLRLQPEEPQQ